jgi:hypothetical protein
MRGEDTYPVIWCTGVLDATTIVVQADTVQDSKEESPKN